MRRHKKSKDNSHLPRVGTEVGLPIPIGEVSHALQFRKELLTFQAHFSANERAPSQLMDLHCKRSMDTSSNLLGGT